MRRHSPYNYAFDNPINFVDPDGRLPKSKGLYLGPGKAPAPAAGTDGLTNEQWIEASRPGNAGVAQEFMAENKAKEREEVERSSEGEDNNSSGSERGNSESYAINSDDAAGSSDNASKYSFKGVDPSRLPRRSNYPKGRWGDFLYKLEETLFLYSFIPGFGTVGGAAKISSQLLFWGNNAKGHLIKHADVLGFNGILRNNFKKGYHN